MKRGEIWTVAGGPDYAGKPRPAVVIQEDGFAETQSITICFLTTREGNGSLVRLSVDPSGRNGLRLASWLMVDKLTTVPKSKVGARIGVLDAEDVSRLNRAIVVFLGLTAPVRSDRPL